VVFLLYDYASFFSVSRGGPRAGRSGPCALPLHFAVVPQGDLAPPGAGSGSSPCAPVQTTCTHTQFQQPRSKLCYCTHAIQPPSVDLGVSESKCTTKAPNAKTPNAKAPNAKAPNAKAPPASRIADTHTSKTPSRGRVIHTCTIYTHTQRHHIHIHIQYLHSAHMRSPQLRIHSLHTLHTYINSPHPLIPGSDGDKSTSLQNHHKNAWT